MRGLELEHSKWVRQIAPRDREADDDLLREVYAFVGVNYTVSDVFVDRWEIFAQILREALDARARSAA